MGPIVKRKKKGRPSKADLARRPISPTPAKESVIRRSVRRRNVRYDIDYYEDYFDVEDEDEDEEEERTREKKLKLVLKLNQRDDSAEPARSRSRSSARTERGSDEEEEEDKPVKKKKIDGVDVSESEEEDDYEEEEERGRKLQAKGEDSIPGTPTDRASVIPLPDRKSLELILDKLQKKDTYGVYAEPVDPEELPDYHDVIENPMDFATVRKKLGNGSYSTLEQFESDVFLICSNAMQYNAPDTVYHRQAHAIQELAKKKFHRLRVGIERCEKELKPEQELRLEKELKLEKDLKSEQRTKPNFLVKKQTKKPFSRTTQEPVGSDFSSGATLATTGDIQNGTVATQVGGYERPNQTDGHVDGNSSLVDNNLEKVEELSSGKGLLSKLGRKQSVTDENRRATYNISNQLVVRSGSIFTTFESEIKQLVAVGLHAEYSYARSLARFAATLGPVAWRVASQRIEQALPAGYKFGRGWVGEYEPLPTPVLMLETTRMQKESALFTKLESPADLWEDNTAFRTPVPAKVHPISWPISEGNSPLFRPANGTATEGKRPLFASAGMKASTPINAVNHKHNPFYRTLAEPENKASKQVELNLPPTSNQSNSVLSGKQMSNKLETAASRSSEMMPRSMNLLQSLPSKQLTNNGVGGGGLPNGKVTSTCGNIRATSPSADNVPNQMARATKFFPHGQEHGINDPVQAMKMLNEKAQNQQNSSNQSPTNTPAAMPSVPSVRRDDSNNAAAAAARAWMSIGAGGFKPATENSRSPKNQISAESLYNPSREFYTQISRVRGEFPLSVGMQFQSEKNSFPPQGFVPQPVRAVNEAQFQNRPVVFPQLVNTDFPRLQMQSPWRGLSPHSQPRQKQEGLPPDLNIGFQSPGSPVKQSSGVLVDSQQPDLALQL